MSLVYTFKYSVRSSVVQQCSALMTAHFNGKE